MAGKIQRIGIVGAGAWGTALSFVVRRAGHEAMLWAYEPEVVEAINGHHENPLYLSGVALDPTVRATGSLAEIAKADALLLVTPAQALRSIATRLAPHIGAGTPVVICAKGIEQRTGALLSEVAVECLPAIPLAVLSGPSFASEVARGLPAALTLACRDKAMGERLVAAIGSARFRPYLSDDLAGAEIGGAVKNVIAIACGIVAGCGLGDNARAALITRGLAEMARLGIAKGARPETFMGLSGLGDLTLTCNGAQSRNFSLGAALGEGRKLDDVLAERRSVAEGVTTAVSAVELAKKLGVEMPISTAVHVILHRGASIDDTVAKLLARPFKNERLQS
ncbi:MAG TPA: NAD(P)H-dependent glycerol-3-phosphate dehydrogenase [Alphaproteobacteria bacterium]|nr:NAD(P)H-dependent glycerol-3-phosphate dehydrogenase [Alphaproteobacteria bacterium]